MKVKISKLNQLVKKALRHYGYSESETKLIFEILMYAQLRGNNQGIVKPIGKGIPKNSKAGKIKVVKQTKLSARIDGKQNMGMVVVSKAVDLALQKAKQHGFGIVGTFNTASSTGAIGYYANKIAKKGMIGLVFAGSPPIVTTHGSYEPLFGTNPLAIGIPSTGQPIVLDMATAAMAYFGLVQAKTAGKKIPGDVAYDSKGKLTTDPGKAIDGAILPFDRSYKSAGLALVVEALCGPFVGAGFIDFANHANNWGNLAMAIDPDLLGDRKLFKLNMSKLANRVKKAKKLKRVKEINFPGERGNRLATQRLNSGYIEIENNLYRALEAVGMNG